MFGWSSAASALASSRNRPLTWLCAAISGGRILSATSWSVSVCLPLNTTLMPPCPRTSTSS